MRRSNILSGDVISGAVLAALGTYITTTARHWTLLGVDGPGPGFFPMCYGIILLGGSLGLVAMGLMRRTGQDEEPVDWTSIANAFGVWLMFALMIPIMKYLGFLIAFGLLIAFFLRVIYPHSWRFALLSAVLTPLGFFLIFPTLLHVELPVGQWTGF